MGVASASREPHQDPEEVEARCIGAVQVLGRSPLEMDDSDLHSRLVAAVNVTLDPEIQEEVRIAAVSARPTSPTGVDDDNLFQPVSEPSAAEVNAVVIDGTKPKITADKLVASWNISLDTAKRTLRATTQVRLRNIFTPSERKV